MLFNKGCQKNVHAISVETELEKLSAWHLQYMEPTTAVRFHALIFSSPEPKAHR